MSTSENENERRAARKLLVYIAVTAFCLLFYLVYDRFTYGSRSPYMTWLFLWPLALGLLPSLLQWRFPRLRALGPVAPNLWHAGVAAVTVSSALRGVLEIAGTASKYQVWLMYLGAALLLGGACAYLLGRRAL